MLVASTMDPPVLHQVVRMTYWSSRWYRPFGGRLRRIRAESCLRWGRNPRARWAAGTTAPLPTNSRCWCGWHRRKQHPRCPNECPYLPERRPDRRGPNLNWIKMTGHTWTDWRIQWIVSGHDPICLVGNQCSLDCHLTQRLTQTVHTGDSGNVSCHFASISYHVGTQWKSDQMEPADGTTW